MTAFGGRTVLPPIKNPVFSLAEDDDVQEREAAEKLTPTNQVNGDVNLNGCHGTSAYPSNAKTPLLPRAHLDPLTEKGRGRSSPRKGTVDQPQVGSTAAGTGSARLERRPKSRTNMLRNEDQAKTTPTPDEPISRLSEIITNARASEAYDEVKTFFRESFESLEQIDRTFQVGGLLRNPAAVDPGINFDYLEYAYESLGHVPKEIEKIVLRSVITSILKESSSTRPASHTRPLLMVLLCPQFEQPATYVIFSHVLRQIVLLEEAGQWLFMAWLRKIPLSGFKRLLRLLLKFITTRLLKKASDELPPVEKTTWWIPTAVKIVSMLHSCNWQQHPPLLPHTAFYCPYLEYIDVMQEYDAWQNRLGRFSFCQYPFLLSITTKRFIIQKDSELKMIAEARQSLVKQVQQRTTPKMGMLFLNLKVRRAHIVSDSLNEVAVKKNDLKKKLRVGFIGEPGLDMGGVSKEWFLILLRKVFRKEYGMFTNTASNRTWWFNHSSMGNEQEFNLVGVLMGLAVYNGMILDVNFPLCCYKKLLSPAVVPFHDANAPVGVSPLALDDLHDVNPELARGLEEMLKYDGDVENDLCQTFQVSFTAFGELKTVDLKPNGGEIPVTSDNRKEYVALYIDFLLNKSVYSQFAAFYHGFHSVCASNALILLRPEEVEILVCGNPDFDMAALHKVTTYDGYRKNDAIIRMFWDVVLGFTLALKKKVLLFVTGSDRVPVGGMSEMQFRITKMSGKNVQLMLPTAHTCFNQLCLPPYKSKKDLKQKLTVAVSNAEGFGME